MFGMRTLMTYANLLSRPKGKAKTDPDLDRLVAAAAAGGHGVNLAKMGDEEIIKRLSRR